MTIQATGNHTTMFKREKVLDDTKNAFLGLIFIVALMNLVFISLFIETEGSPFIIFHLFGIILGCFLLIIQFKYYADNLIFIIATILIISGAVIIIFYFGYLDIVLPIILGFAPTYSILQFHISIPYEVKLVSEYNDGIYHFTRTFDYIIYKDIKNYEIMEDSKIELNIQVITALKSLTGNYNYYNHIVVNHPKSLSDPIPIVPNNIKGLPLLSILVNLFPKNIQISTMELDRTTGGFLSFLEPKINAVNISPSIKTNYGNKITIESLEETITNPDFHQHRENQIKLSGLLLWGLILELIIGSLVVFFGSGFYIFLADHLYLQSFILASFGFFGIIMMIWFGRRFLSYPIAHRFGQYNIKEQNDEIHLYNKKCIFTSNTYRIPLNLNPRIINIGKKVSIICRDEYREYYKLTIGELN